MSPHNPLQLKSMLRGTSRVIGSPLTRARLNLTALLFGVSFALFSSDHGDAPVIGGEIRRDANLTDLHAFVVGSDLVISVCSNDAIPRSAAGYVFPTDVTFDINVDNDSPVSPDDPSNMGGTILYPEKVWENVTFRIRFGENNLPQVQTIVHSGRRSPVPQPIVWAGLRDDPFIRGPRQGRNVAAIVLQVPLSSLIRFQSTLLIWATSKVEGVEGISNDLAGRSLRSMMAENRDMNSMPPDEHTDAMGVAPDVMIFDTSRPAAFPNGRALTDDVVDLIGDPRVLVNDSPFPSANDLPFLDVFPYLAPPHPPQ